MSSGEHVFVDAGAWFALAVVRNPLRGRGRSHRVRREKSTCCTLDVPRTLARLNAVIRSFRSTETQAIYEGRRSRRFGNIQNAVERKLGMLDAAVALDDLRSPPGNRLEALVGNRAGQFSIRVNDQFRICFRWAATGPEDVEIVDYH